MQNVISCTRSWHEVAFPPNCPILLLTACCCPSETLSVGILLKKCIWYHFEPAFSLKSIVWKVKEEGELDQLFCPNMIKVKAFAIKSPWFFVSLHCVFFPQNINMSSPESLSFLSQASSHTTHSAAINFSHVESCQHKIFHSGFVQWKCYLNNGYSQTLISVLLLVYPVLYTKMTITINQGILPDNLK